jgi:hypothetical protein
MPEKKIYLLLLLLFISALPAPILAQEDVGFIYGKVTSLSGTTYQGQIRWGKEEAFWYDIFNATKTSENENTYERIAPDKKNTNWWENLDGSILRIWDDEYSSQTHQFTCRFGDIKSISPHGNTIDCEFKNGIRMKLKGGSNDVGATIIVKDYELGVVKLRWDKIKKVEFENAPKQLEDKLGMPLFGLVKTTTGQLEGFVQWDKDERLDTDLLQGSSSSEKLEIAFAKISCIKNQGNKSQVQLRSGKILVMHGTNDVNEENRGIVVSGEGVGQIEIPWRSFTSVCFSEHHKDSGPAYNTYSNPKRLYGNVKDLTGNQYDGLIIFDKDEKWDFEQLEGIHNDLKYIIPFRNIKTIIPKNRDYTYVILRNQEKLILGNLQDVSSKNEGLVVILSNSESKFIDWSQIDEITFE